MNVFYNKKGLTLIEVIIALAILGIILIAFLSVFTNSITTMHSMGFRTKAVYQDAQAIVEEIYSNNTINNVTSTTALQTIILQVLNNNYTSDQIETTPFAYGSPPTTQLNNEIVRFSVGPETTVSGVNGYPFTILVFYQNGKKTVKLTSFVTKGGI